jgi:beta-N-acetylhexosaminidase
MTARAFITGISGATLTHEERCFLRETAPWGLILFARNIETPAQVAGLTAAFRDEVGRKAPVLIDQEGGRVQRMGPPHWPAYPAGAAYGLLYDQERAMALRAAHLGARLIASDLAAVGIDVDCLPLADVPVGGANPIIGDRAMARPGQCDACARLPRAPSAAYAVLNIPAMAARPPTATENSRIVETDRATLEATDFAAFRRSPTCPWP